MTLSCRSRQSAFTSLETCAGGYGDKGQRTFNEQHSNPLPTGPHLVKLSPHHRLHRNNRPRLQTARACHAPVRAGLSDMRTSAQRATDSPVSPLANRPKGHQPSRIKTERCVHTYYLRCRRGFFAAACGSTIAMEVISDLEEHIDLPPTLFSGDLIKKVKKRFREEFVGKPLPGHGEILEIVSFKRIEQKPLRSTGDARFQVSCRAKVFRIVPGDIVAGRVVRVDPVGVFAQFRGVTVMCPIQYYQRGLWRLVGDILTGPGPDIRQGQSHNFKIMAVRFGEKGLSALAEPTFVEQ
jgi:DNA-directed RNA polymerase subunit E'/Rpb7